MDIQCRVPEKSELAIVHLRGVIQQMRVESQARSSTGDDRALVWETGYRNALIDVVERVIAAVHP